MWLVLCVETWHDVYCVLCGRSQCRYVLAALKRHQNICYVIHWHPSAEDRLRLLVNEHDMI